LFFSKHILNNYLLKFLFLSLLASSVFAYSGGTGEPNAPYQIAAKSDLLALAANTADYGKSFILTADIDNNFIVDFFDFAILANNWRHSGPNLKGDLTKDLHVDFKDLLILADAWLDCLVQPSSGPNPADSATNVNPNGILRWTAGEGALSHNVYLGIGFNDVNKADTLSPKFKGTQAATNYGPSNLDVNTTYYWRIDEVGPRCTAKGDVWSFTTVLPPPGAATNPKPANHSIVSITTDLSWNAGAGATSRDLFFGTVNPPTNRVESNSITTTYDTGTMAEHKKYYWQTNEQNSDGNTASPVWDFNTAGYGNHYGNGNGSNEANAIDINSALAWECLAATPADWSKYIKVSADVNFVGATVAPVGDRTTRFTGTLNGNNKTFSNFTIASIPDSSGAIALIRRLGGSAVFKNLTLLNASVTGHTVAGEQSYCGWAVGEAVHGAKVDDINAVNCTMIHDHNVAGFPAYCGLVAASHADINNCHSSGTISVDSVGSVLNVGGISGFTGSSGTAGENGSVKNSTSSVTIQDLNGASTAPVSIGGICAATSTTGNVEDINNCHFTGVIDYNSKSYVYAGGVVGEIGVGGVYKCSAVCPITVVSEAGTTRVGGIAGIVDDMTKVKYSFAKCPLRINYSGAIIGGCFGGVGVATITDCFAGSGSSLFDLKENSTVLNFNYGGGFAGSVSGATISRCFAVQNPYSAKVGTSHILGFVGYDPTTTLSSCFWDVNSSGVTTTNTGATGKTTAQMQTRGTFAGYDFSSTGKWKMRASIYPLLSWQTYTYVTDPNLVGYWPFDDNAATNKVLNVCGTDANYYGKDHATVAAATWGVYDSTDPNKDYKITVGQTGSAGNNYTCRTASSAIIAADAAKIYITGTDIIIYNRKSVATPLYTAPNIKTAWDACSAATAIGDVNVFNPASTAKTGISITKRNFIGGVNEGDVNTTTFERSVTDKVGGALSFNGSTDYVDTLNTFQSTIRNSFSVRLMYKITAYSESQIFIFGAVDTSATMGLAIYIDPEDGLMFRYENGDDYVLAPAGLPQLNAWYDIAVSIEKLTTSTARISFYINGSLEDQEDFPAAMDNFTTEQTIKMGYSHFIGLIHDVRIYNKALSSTEIQQLYLNP
jgi:hypothetical protein